MVDISVVIPTKDRLPYLRRAIPIFLSQREVKEVIVVVDGCSDGSLAYVRTASEGDPRIRYTDNVVNRGLPYSRNKGLALARCEYAFTGEDDLELSEGFFTTLLRHLDESGADLIAARNVFRGERESQADAAARTGRLAGPAVNPRTLIVNVQLRTPGDQEQSLLPAPMLGRTDVFRKVGYDESYRGNAWREESDFQLSAREAGYKLVYCPHTISYNIEIENDHGGVHATSGYKRLGWQVRNNWLFVSKHRQIIASEFQAGHPCAYIAWFTATRLLHLLYAQLLWWKQQVLGTWRKQRLLGTTGSTGSTGSAHAADPLVPTAPPTGSVDPVIPVDPGGPADFTGSTEAGPTETECP